MFRSDPRTLLDKMVGICCSLLLAAVALYEAVRLIERIWVALIVITCVVALLAGSVMLLRARHRSW